MRYAHQNFCSSIHTVCMNHCPSSIHSVWKLCTASSCTFLACVRQSPERIFSKATPLYGNQHNQPMEQQQGMPQHSYSSTATDGLTIPNSNPMRTIRSVGQLHSLARRGHWTLSTRPRHLHKKRAQLLSRNRLCYHAPALQHGREKMAG